MNPVPSFINQELPVIRISENNINNNNKNFPQISSYPQIEQLSNLQNNPQQSDDKQIEVLSSIPKDIPNLDNENINININPSEIPVKLNPQNNNFIQVLKPICIKSDDNNSDNDNNNFVIKTSHPENNKITMAPLNNQKSINNIDNDNNDNNIKISNIPNVQMLKYNINNNKDNDSNKLSIPLEVINKNNNKTIIKQPQLFPQLNIPTVYIPPNEPPKIENPEGINSEMYQPGVLEGQKILIVMTYEQNDCNIQKLFQNGESKTVKQAVEHFGIELVAVDNYRKAIKEITKNENGKCPYYACWILSCEYETDSMADFMNILIKFWKNGGAVVLFSDNTPLICETNYFLNLINAGFILEGEYFGRKNIYGDATGTLSQPGVFNRNKNIYKYNNIQRQSLCHNLYIIFEGETIASVTKDGKRKMDVKYDDIAPFIPFARDSEGGITSLFKLASDNGEGDLIIDGGYTKLFINMKENGTFRYIQNIAGFTGRPEVHDKQGITPKLYRPNAVSK